MIVPSNSSKVEATNSNKVNLSKSVNPVKPPSARTGFGSVGTRVTAVS